MDLTLCTQKLEFLLDKYGVAHPECALSQGPSLEVGGRKVFLPYWRQERRFVELKRMLKSGQGGFPCSMRVKRFVSSGNQLSEQLMREIDLCEWILESKVISIYGTRCHEAANYLVSMEGGTLCTLEIACTLPPNTQAMDSHEVITRRGVASDRVVDTQVPQHSVYQFTQDAEAKYTDTDFELFGLSEEEAMAVRCAHYAISENAYDEFACLNEHLQKLVALADRSICDNCKVMVIAQAEEAGK